jgi:hypothetical protein
MSASSSTKVFNVSSQFWNIVSDFAGVRFAIDADALLSRYVADRRAVQPLALAFEVESYLARISLRYAAFDLICTRSIVGQ